MKPLWQGRNAKKEIETIKNDLAEYKQEVTEPLKSKTFSAFLKIVLVAVFVLSVIVFFSGIMKYNEKKKEREKIEKEIKETKYEIGELEHYLDSPIDDDYIIRIMREKFDLHFPDEDIYYND